MKIEQIETFLMINQTKSLSIAGEKLFVSQSTVSHRIHSLEQELGFNLLVRARGERYVSLTSKGEEFVELAKRWVSLSNETKLWKVQESKMVLRLAGVDSLNTCVFSNLYKELISKDNSLSINVTSHWSKTTYDLVENREADVGFALSSLKYPNVISELLFKSRGVVISSKYPAKVHPNDLKTSDEIVFSYMPEYELWHNIWWENDRNEYTSVDTVSLLYRTFELEDKWAIVPIWMARVFEKTHSLRISELSVTPPEYSCYQVYNRHPKPRKIKAIKMFSKALEDYMETETFLSSID